MERGFLPSDPPSLVGRSPIPGGARGPAPAVRVSQRASPAPPVPAPHGPRRAPCPGATPRPQPGPSAQPRRDRGPRHRVDSRLALLAIALAASAAGDPAPAPVQGAVPPYPSPPSPDPPSPTPARAAAPRAGGCACPDCGVGEPPPAALPPVAARLATLAAALPPPSVGPTAAAAAAPAGPSPSLPRVYGWLRVGDQRSRVLILLDSGATHNLVSPRLAARWPQARVPPGPEHPGAVRQADGTSRATQGTLRVDLLLGTLEEPTTFSVFDVGCGVDILLGFPWLRDHDLAFLYEDSQVSFCAAAGCPDPRRRVRLDVAHPFHGPASASALMSPRELRSLLGHAGLGAASLLDRPSLWRPPPASHGPAAAAAACEAAAQDAWAADTLAGLAEHGLTLEDGTEVGLGTISIAAEDLSFGLPAAEQDPAEFESLKTEFATVLAGPPPGMPPDRGPEYELHIDTGDSAMPRSRPMKRWSQGELDECRRQIAILLDNGWIRPSRASHAASIVFARKADGSWRFCQDYRQLNALTKKSVEPLPHIDQLLDETRGARFFTKLDLASAYHQFRIRESDVYKTSFRVPGGQYEFRVGAFGLHGMASLLMRYMHAIFSRPALAFDQAGRPTGPANGHGPSMLGSFVACYMDDILVFSRTAAEHQAHVRMVLETLQHHRLFAKASKCEFCRSSVAFLGHVISAAGVAVDPRKTSAVADWARPASCTDVRRFIGLANYYRRFCKHFAAMAAPLTALCSPHATFHWGPPEQAAFEAIKQALVTAPVLRVWDGARATRLVTDASELAVSAILEQPDDAGAWHPVAFESRKLTLPERRYPPHLLELLAVVHGLRTFRPYLLDKPFVVHTDNASLQWLQQQRSLSHFQARWLDIIAEFKFDVVHIPGRTNPADFLSRMRFASGTEPAPHAGYDPDGPGAAAELFAALGTPSMVFTAAGSSPDPTAPRFLHPDFAEAVGAATLTDDLFGRLAQAAQAAAGAPVSATGEPLPINAQPVTCFVWRQGLLYRRSARGDRLCVPSVPDLRRRVLEELHATPLGGHFGRDKTIALARRLVWWPALLPDLDLLIRSCPTCPRIKAEHGPPAGLLYPLPVPSRRGGTISLDFIELPRARSGHDFLQVHIDLLTGRVWLVPTFKTATAETAALNFMASVFRSVGLPDTIVSDRDVRFTADLWTSLHRALGSTLIFGSPHHHNTTSKVERVNGVIEDVLRAFVNDRQDNWPDLISLVEFAINDSASPLGTGYTPFYADRGQHPRRPLAPPDDAASPAAVGGGDALARLMDHVTGEVRALLQERQDTRKARLDPGRRDVRFEPGDEVLLDTSHTPLPSRGSLASRWMGPFQVLRQTAPNTYQLDLQPTWKAVDEFNVS